MEWNLYGQEMIKAKARDSFIPEPTEGGVELFRKSLEDEVKRINDERELNLRRKWAAMIRAEWDKYHDHSADNAECGSCGAIQAANWMDPDFKGDGPEL